MEDLKTVDPTFYNSLLWLRRNKVTADLDMTFSVTREVAGEVQEVELLPGGSELLVTDANKEQFIGLMLKWRLEKNVEEQLKPFLNGLYSVVGRSVLRLLDAADLELVLSGSMDIDLEDWRRNTEYKGFSDAHLVVCWFWQCVYEMNNEERLQLLQVSTDEGRG